MKFFVPGKTFLVGEYSVLLNGAALGLATRPYFEFDLVEELGVQPTNFHAASPAGKYLQQNSKTSQIIFKDNYSDIGVNGGFGRSTAEYFAAIVPDLLARKKVFLIF